MIILAFDITLGLYAFTKSIIALPGIAYRSTKAKLANKKGVPKELKALD